jgi:F0F1-type ATP synthase epsilon subunit
MTDYTETRSMLKKLAMAHGAETAIGRACHNLLEMTEKLEKSKDADQQIQLKANINRELARLNDLKKSAS